MTEIKTLAQARYYLDINETLIVPTNDSTWIYIAEDEVSVNVIAVPKHGASEVYKIKDGKTDEVLQTLLPVYVEKGLKLKERKENLIDKIVNLFNFAKHGFSEVTKIRIK